MSAAIKELLAEVPLFEGLSDADLNVVAQRVRQISRKENSAIFHRNDPGVALYVIVNGKIKIHNETPDGGDAIIAILNDGEFFGELAVLDGEERSADATTLEPTEMLMLTKDDFHDIIHRNPRISVRILATLAGRLRRTTNAFLAYSTLDVNGRLALQLLRLAEQNGIVTGNGVRIDLRLTQTDLGSLVGASRESVNKVMGFFRRQGYVAVDDRGQITLKNSTALERLCEGHS
jgi:CRP/FNR family transcriptional regulator/CRP/FNR family cyclic AMP-dependent transcriptional regulator